MNKMWKSWLIAGFFMLVAGAALAQPTYQPMSEPPPAPPDVQDSALAEAMAQFPAIMRDLEALYLAHVDTPMNAFRDPAFGPLSERMSGAFGELSRLQASVDSTDREKAAAYMRANMNWAQRAQANAGGTWAMVRDHVAGFRAQAQELRTRVNALIQYYGFAGTELAESPAWLGLRGKIDSLQRSAPALLDELASAPDTLQADGLAAIRMAQENILIWQILTDVFATGEAPNIAADLPAWRHYQAGIKALWADADELPAAALQRSADQLYERLDAFNKPFIEAGPFVSTEPAEQRMPTPHEAVADVMRSVLVFLVQTQTN